MTGQRLIYCAGCIRAWHRAATAAPVRAQHTPRRARQDARPAAVLPFLTFCGRHSGRGVHGAAVQMCGEVVARQRIVAVEQHAVQHGALGLLAAPRALHEGRGLAGADHREPLHGLSRLVADGVPVRRAQGMRPVRGSAAATAATSRRLGHAPRSSAPLLGPAPRPTHTMARE